MLWFVLAPVTSFVVDLLVVRQHDDRGKDLEILLLRHQVRWLQRHQPQPPRVSRWEKLILAVLAATLAHLTTGPGRRLGQIVLLYGRYDWAPNTHTRRPILAGSTPSPTDSITPAPSLCGMIRGKCIPHPNQSLRFFVSPGFTPERMTRTRTSPGPGVGAGSSPTWRTSRAGPCRSYQTARINPFPPPRAPMHRARRPASRSSCGHWIVDRGKQAPDEAVQALLFVRAERAVEHGCHRGLACLAGSSKRPRSDRCEDDPTGAAVITIRFAADQPSTLHAVDNLAGPPTVMRIT